MRSRSISLWSGMFTLAIAAGVALNIWIASLQDRYYGPGPHQDARVVMIVPNSGLATISEQLENEGVVESAWLFSAGARYRDAARNLKAGEYEIPVGASMADVLDIVTDGRSINYDITVPEGLTSYQIVQILNESELLTGEVAEIPAEGSLAPNTYAVLRGQSRQSLIDKMASAQSETLDRLWEGRAPDLPIDTKEEALTLASIVETETAVARERSLVAGLFYNRLREGMKLQSDVTIIYGITGGEHPRNGLPLGRSITRTDIRTATPYNTYTIPALPPGPIANPGEASIAAVMNPAASDYLFFVADCGGGHAFSKTNREHERNVAAYRQCEKQLRAKRGG